MLAFERRGRILNILHQDRKVYVSQLSKQFNVTEETIRRDLEKLEKDTLVTRTYGGAILNSPTAEDLSYQMRQTRNLEEKRYIASKLLPLINDEHTLMADPSSTVFECLRTIIPNRRKLTVITNSSTVLQEFSSSYCNIISTGGTLRPESNSLVGSIANDTVKKYIVDVAIFSCKGLSPGLGIMDSNEPESELKKVMLKQANKIVLVVDHTKFDRASFVKLFDFSDIDYIVTDKKPADPWLKLFAQNNVQVIY